MSIFNGMCILQLRNHVLPAGCARLKGLTGLYHWVKVEAHKLEINLRISHFFESDTEFPPAVSVDSIHGAFREILRQIIYRSHGLYISTVLLEDLSAWGRNRSSLNEFD